MIQKKYRYTRTLVLGEDFLKDTGNKYQFVSQKPYKGKVDADGNEVIPAGVTCTLMIVEDHSDPVVDKNTGEIKENNELQTFDATIIGVQYPLALKKRDFVSLGNFMEEISYYVDFHFILRFGKIFPYKERDHD